MEGQEVTPPVVLSEAARRAAQSKDLFSGARCAEAKRGPSTALRFAQDDGGGATLTCHPERSEGSFAALRMTQVVESRL
jgi:hypothetical protein